MDFELKKVFDPLMRLSQTPLEWRSVKWGDDSIRPAQSLQFFMPRNPSQFSTWCFIKKFNQLLLLLYFLFFAAIEDLWMESVFLIVSYLREVVLWWIIITHLHLWCCHCKGIIIQIHRILILKDSDVMNTINAWVLKFYLRPIINTFCNIIAQHSNLIFCHWNQLYVLYD